MEKYNENLFQKWSQWDIKNIDKLIVAYKAYKSYPFKDCELFQMSLENKFIMENLWRIKTFGDYLKAFWGWDDWDLTDNLEHGEAKAKMSYLRLFEEWGRDSDDTTEFFDSWDEKRFGTRENRNQDFIKDHQIFFRWFIDEQDMVSKTEETPETSQGGQR